MAVPSLPPRRDRCIVSSYDDLSGASQGGPRAPQHDASRACRAERRGLADDRRFRGRKALAQARRLGVDPRRFGSGWRGLHPAGHGRAGRASRRPEAWLALHTTGMMAVRPLLARPTARLNMRTWEKAIRARGAPPRAKMRRPSRPVTPPSGRRTVRTSHSAAR
jgi:hypothetical protein